jgi:hypothetical protein
MFGAASFLACNSSQSNFAAQYPREVDSLRINDLFDSAKWDVYTWNCDLIYKPKTDSTLCKPLSELELTFENLTILHDTIILIFAFLDRGQSILPAMTQDNLQPVSGVGFNTSSKKKLFMVSSNVYISVKGDPRSRFINPMQPEVLSFIRKNKEKLNPWFKQEAIRRKII